jgi:mRNA-degrading endonuclease RelE of RelBE toxin-antitoxin system
VIGGIPSSSRAEREYARLDPQVQERVKRKLDDLNASPRDPRLSKQLIGHRDVRSARIGDWRVLFLVEPCFFVERIEHRRQVYRRLGI